MSLFSWALCMVGNMLNAHILEADFTPIFMFHAVPCTQLLTNFGNYASRMSLTVSEHILKNMLKPCLATVRTSTTLCLKIVSCLIWHRVCVHHKKLVVKKSNKSHTCKHTKTKYDLSFSVFRTIIIRQCTK